MMYDTAQKKEIGERMQLFDILAIFDFRFVVKHFFPKDVFAVLMIMCWWCDVLALSYDCIKLHFKMKENFENSVKNEQNLGEFL